MKNLEHLLSCNPRAELARRNLIDFVMYMKPLYEANWHHVLLCEYLQKFVTGEIKRLMVFMPPQHGKSELVSRNLPAYLLGKTPTAKIVLASYSASLSSSFNRDCQRIIECEEYQETFSETRLNSNSNYRRNSEIFEVVKHGGFLKTVGVGGSLTGTPADYAIIDDPVKDSIEAMSPTYQQRNWDWFNDVLYTRIHNNTGILITQTRWDVNDLSGMLLKSMANGGEQWVILSLQGLKTTDAREYDHRQIGEVLWPSKHSMEKLEQVRSRSVRTFEALYQQNPRPVMAGGEFWKSFNPAKHVKHVAVAKATIHVSIDENVNPYVTQTIWQIFPDTQAINQVHEILSTSPNNNAPKAAKQFINWLAEIGHNDVVFIYGDPSAGKKSTVDENNASFFDKYIQILQQHKVKIVRRIGKSAPEVALSAAFVNEIYEHNYNGWSINISDKCVISIEDYYSVKEAADGTMQKVKKKSMETGVTYEPWGHCSDAKRYFIIHALMAEWTKYKARTKKYFGVSS
jgi:hypothetical protein